MKVFIVTANHIKGHKFLCNLGNKLHNIGTKNREIAEKVASEKGGEVFSILINDTKSLVSKAAQNEIYKEAKRICAI
jgi:hypothetical protein